MYVCMYVCVYMCIYTHIHIHIYIYTLHAPQCSATIASPSLASAAPFRTTTNSNIDSNSNDTNTIFYYDY